MAYFNGLMMSVAVICILGNAGTLWHINKYIYIYGMYVKYDRSSNVTCKKIKVRTRMYQVISIHTTLTGIGASHITT